MMYQENDRKMIIILPTCIKYLPHLQLIKNKRTVELNAQEHTHSLVVMMHNENTKVTNNNQFIYYHKRVGGAAAQKHDLTCPDYHCGKLKAFWKRDEKP